MKLPQNITVKKKDLLSHPTMFKSRYFLSNCAKRVNVTHSWFGFSFSSKIYFHSHMGIWFTIRFSRPFFYCFHRVSWVENLLWWKNPHQTTLGQTMPHHAYHCLERFLSEGPLEAGRFCPWPRAAKPHSPRGGTCPPPATGFAMHLGHILHWPWFMQNCWLISFM